MKSIRSNPRNHAAEGDERIRTAVTEPSTDPAYERRVPQPGDVWASRDSRDNGLHVTVLAVSNGYVRIQRFRKSTVSLRRFHSDYLFVRGGAR